MTDSSVLYISYTYIAVIWEKWKINQNFVMALLVLSFYTHSKEMLFRWSIFCTEKKIAHLKLKEVRYKKKPISKFKTDTFDQF